MLETERAGRRASPLPMRNLGLAVAAALAAASPASAAVKNAAANGFEIESKTIAAASPADVYATLGQPALWWDDEHTFSHDAHNLSLDLRAGGCFCEQLPKTGGSVQHMQVVNAQPRAGLRLQGALGPLQGEGVSGSLTITLKPVGQGTEITLNYIVGGYFRPGEDKLVTEVDQVLTAQLERLRRRLETRAP
jgi:uncharacterized protein YndB with AHSA1/START domain